jgi:hypothetical protein
VDMRSPQGAKFAQCTIAKRLVNCK